MNQGTSPYSPPKSDLEGNDSAAGASSLATPGPRLAAYIMDSLVFTPGLMAAGLISAATRPAANLAPTERGATIGGAVAIAWCIAVGIFQVAQLSRRGQTIGKRLMKIRIVKLDGSLPGFMVAVVLRSVVGGLPWVIPFYGLVDGLFVFRPDRRCIHDHIAGTRVVMAETSPAPMAVAAM